MSKLYQLLIADFATLSLALYAWLADRRRQRRRDIDRVGVINWVTVFVLAVLVLLFAVVLTMQEWLGS